MPMPTLTAAEAETLLGIPLELTRRWVKKGLITRQAQSGLRSGFDTAQLTQLHDQHRGISRCPNRYRVLRGATQHAHRVVELFAGAGGSALGFHNAGFQHEALFEIDRWAAETLRRNSPGWSVVEGDVADVDFSQYSADVVAGGFPCQAFSYAGNKRGFEDTRGTLFFEFARAVAEIRPKIAIGENVRGLLKHENGQTLSTMVGVLQELGYRVEYRVVRAQFHDVPQKRERLILMAVRDDLDTPILFPKEQRYTVTVAEALENVPPSHGQNYPLRKRQILDRVPPGGYWRDLSDELQREYMKGSYFLGGGKTGVARRLAWNEPSLTLTTSPAQKQTERCHPGESRPLTVREYARIQTFPDSWEFAGSMSSQYRQIGNAVPVNLGYHVGRCVAAMLR